MTHQDQPPFAVPAQFAMPDFGHLGAGHFARLPDRLLAAESRERLQEPGDDDVGQMLALQQVEPPGVAKTGIGAQMCDLGQLLRPGEDASDEAQRQILHRQRLAPPARDPCKVSLRMARRSVPTARLKMDIGGDGQPCRSFSEGWRTAFQPRGVCWRADLRVRRG